jgi:hypothetical protein
MEPNNMNKYDERKRHTSSKLRTICITSNAAVKVLAKTELRISGLKERKWEDINGKRYLAEIVKNRHTEPIYGKTVHR